MYVSNKVYHYIKFLGHVTTDSGDFSADHPSADACIHNNMALKMTTKTCDSISLLNACLIATLM